MSAAPARSGLRCSRTASRIHPAGLVDDNPLSRMYRLAREARIYDGPDEVHIQSVARRILKTYRDGGPGWDFGERDADVLYRGSE